jgi:Carboxypeptidase regulatory-like domain
MRRVLLAGLPAVLAAALAAQHPDQTQLKRAAVKSAPRAAAAAVATVAPTATGISAISDLPVRKVVLYKNGVGYFEHAGTVTGDQRVAIDFTSSQLNDVLQSLTALDFGGGKVSAVGYNSTTPIEQQLDSLSLGLKDFPATIAVYQSLRGQRVEVTGAGAPIAGRLVNVEFRKETDKNGETSDDHYFLIVETDGGALRTAEIGDGVSVRMVDPAIEKEFASYLEIIGSAQNQQGRHLTLDDRGAGQRNLQVSYISQVPVWKSTYRIVFPRDAKDSATVQGWAVVDNTVGVDWDNVQLSLVAGAPQSFIQPLSQPLYTSRPTIPIATVGQYLPTTHEAAEMQGPGGINGVVTDAAGAVIPNATVTATGAGQTITRMTAGDGSFSFEPLPPGQYTLRISARGFETYVEQSINVSGMTTASVSPRLNVGAATESVTVTAGRMKAPMPMLAPGIAGRDTNGLSHGIGNRAADALVAGNGVGYGAGYGGVYRASDALSEGDVSTNAFDDFFEYALAQPVTIHKNESAMVPILQQELPASHVTLWSDREPRALRAIWLENKSKLTLDSGSFSIFESGEFAGEGLLDPIHPGEKRLLSYAVDQAVKVRPDGMNDTRTLRHIAVHKGILVETTSEVTETKYTINNAGDEQRAVVVEHTRRNGAELTSETKPEETTSTAYRFKVGVGPHQSAELQVKERANLFETVVIGKRVSDDPGFLLAVSKYSPEIEEKLRPVIAAEGALETVNDKLDENDDKQQKLTEDETRDRDNLTALKGNDAAKRFVEELNQAEDALQAAKKEQTDLEAQRDAAQAKLDDLIAKLQFETDLNAEAGSGQ